MRVLTTKLQAVIVVLAVVPQALGTDFMLQFRQLLGTTGALAGFDGESNTGLGEANNTEPGETSVGSVGEGQSIDEFPVGILGAFQGEEEPIDPLISQVPSSENITQEACSQRCEEKMDESDQQVRQKAKECNQRIWGRAVDMFKTNQFSTADRAVVEAILEIQVKRALSGCGWDSDIASDGSDCPSIEQILDSMKAVFSSESAPNSPGQMLRRALLACAQDAKSMAPRDRKALEEVLNHMVLAIFALGTKVTDCGVEQNEETTTAMATAADGARRKRQQFEFPNGPWQAAQIPTTR